MSYMKGQQLGHHPYKAVHNHKQTDVKKGIKSKEHKKLPMKMHFLQVIPSIMHLKTCCLVHKQASKHYDLKGKRLGQR